MLLPNGNRARVDIRKLRDYCLNPDHPRGSNKARVFARALGITRRDAARLRARLFEIAGSEEATIGELDLYGQRYTIDFEVETDVGRALIRSGLFYATKVCRVLRPVMSRKGRGNVQEENQTA